MRSRNGMPLAVYVLALGIFSITTSEFMVSGLVLSMAAELGVSVPAIGYLISVYAAAMALGGPVLAALLLRVPWRRALLIIVGLFLAGQMLGAVAPTYPVMVVARAVTGLAASAFFGVALAIAADLVTEARRARASSVVLGGLMVGTVLGLPAAVLIGNAAGWRAAFWAVAALAAAAGLAALATLPTAQGTVPAPVREELSALRDRHLWAVFATSLLTIAATFAAFSYATPILVELTGFSPTAVPGLLAAYGAATVVGNIVVGRLADRGPVPVMVVGLSLLTGFLVLFALTAADAVLAVFALIGIGLVGVTMNPAMVARVMRAANARPLVNTVHTAVITTGVLIGSAAGAAAIDAGYGLTAPLWIGAALSVLGLATLLPETSNTHRSTVTNPDRPTPTSARP